MVESGNSGSASGSPAYASERFKMPTWSVLVNASVVADAILERVELGFGSDFSTAIFTLPRDPSSLGNPVKNDNVQVIVNGRSVFIGKIKIISKHIGRDGLRLTYTAHSNIVAFNRVTILSGAFNSEGSDYPGLLFTVSGIFNQLGISAAGTPGIFPGDINVTDQTKLAAAESILNKVGNYKLYFDMNADTLHVYSLGSGGINQRSFLIGKNILNRDVNISTENIVDRVVVVGPPIQVTRRIPLHLDDEDIRTDANGRRRVAFRLTGVNVRDIAVEGMSREQPKIEYDVRKSVSKAMLISPNPIDLPDFDFTGDFSNFKEVDDDEDETLHRVILSESNFRTDWSTVSVSLEQDGPNSVVVFLSAVPKIWYAKTIRGVVLNSTIGITPDGPDDTTTVEIFDGYRYHVGALRVTYTVDSAKPTASSGSGAIMRSITDSQYQIIINSLSGFNNTTFVLNQMSTRAAAELARLNVPEISGTIRVLGDETIDLRQSVVMDSETLDILHVTHNFTNGFTTDVTITNEKLRLNAISLPAVGGGRGRLTDSERDRRRGLLIQNSNADILRKKNQQLENEAKLHGEELSQMPWAVYKK